MRALRGITAVTLTALAITFASTAAMATEPDDGPTAAVVPGSTASYVGWPATNQEYIGQWTDADGTAVSVPRTATTVELRLPDEVLALPFSTATITAHAIGTGSVQVAQWGDDFTSGSVTFDLNSLLATAASYGVPDTGMLEIWVTSSEDGVILDLLIDVLLTASAPAGPAVVDLGVPSSKSHSQALEATAVRAAPGGQITVMAWPGFFGQEAPAPVVRFVNSAWNTSVDVTGTMTIWGDGEYLTVVVPPDVSSYAWLDIESGTGTPTRYTVTARLLPPSTEAVEAYVTAVYNDLFGREPDPTGLAGWTYALTHGKPYSAVTDAITASDEFRMGLITDAYWIYLGRGPDPAGLAGWLRAMNRGLQIQQMEAGFLASDEYFTVWGEGTNAGWIEALYVDVVGRAASPAEVSAWLPAIAREGREQVARGFLYSTEKLASDVDGYYQWLLRRPLDAVGREGWVRLIQGGVRVEVIIAGIIASDEYRNNVPVG